MDPAREGHVSESRSDEKTEMGEQHAAKSLDKSERQFAFKMEDPVWGCMNPPLARSNTRGNFGLPLANVFPGGTIKVATLNTSF